MNKQTRKDFIDLFAEGFQGVVVPEIEELRKDMDKGFKNVNEKLNNVEGRLKTVENRLESVEVKLDRVAANQLRSV